jgi:hypothetical protein
MAGHGCARAGLKLQQNQLVDLALPVPPKMNGR